MIEIKEGDKAHVIYGGPNYSVVIVSRYTNNHLNGDWYYIRGGVIEKRENRVVLENK